MTGNYLDKFLLEAIEEWYSTWHRFAEEDEEPPEHWQRIAQHLWEKGYKTPLDTPEPTP